MAGLETEGKILLTSGRISGELINWPASVPPIVCSRTSPTSLSRRPGRRLEHHPGRLPAWDRMPAFTPIGNAFWSKDSYLTHPSGDERYAAIDRTMETLQV
ncbi:MAG: hypothetical protein R3D55_26730 [Chloroflexota bacterium]